jgi:hypothetical protein
MYLCMYAIFCLCLHECGRSESIYQTRIIGPNISKTTSTLSLWNSHGMVRCMYYNDVCMYMYVRKYICRGVIHTRMNINVREMCHNVHARACVQGLHSFWLQQLNESTCINT